MSDTVSDMLTCIRNGQARGKVTIVMSLSNLKCEIAKLLKTEGYISDFVVDKERNILEIKLKYYRGKPVIDFIKRISRPGKRVYCSKHKIPKVRNGLGIVIISTSKGLVTDRTARLMGQGGEILAMVA